MNRLPRLARPASSLLTQPRLALTRPSIRTAATAQHKSDDHSHGDHGHDSHYDPPGGWLWGIRPGEKYEKEGWESMAWVFVAAWVIGIAAYTMKEDTS